MNVNEDVRRMTGETLVTTKRQKLEMQYNRIACSHYSKEKTIYGVHFESTEKNVMTHSIPILVMIHNKYYVAD